MYKGISRMCNGKFSALLGILLEALSHAITGFLGELAINYLSKSRYD